MNDIQGKDRYRRRIAGITQSIYPPIRVTVNFIEWDGKIIVEIIVPKGREPLYYYRNNPYLRDLSISRKAHPAEVAEFHRKYLNEKSVVEEENEIQEFLRDLILLLSDFEVVWSDVENRSVNPYLNQCQFEFRKIAAGISNLEYDPILANFKLLSQVREFKVALEDLQYHQFYIGRKSWEEFLEKGNHCSEIVMELYEYTRSKMPRSETLRPNFEKIIRAKVNKMKELWINRKKYLERGTIGEFKEQLYELAIVFHRLGSYSIADLYNNLTFKLRNFGKKLMTLSSLKYFRGGFGDPFIWLSEVIDEYFALADEIVEKITQ